MKKTFLLYLVLFFCTMPMLAKIVIFTYSYNRPDFIELQHKTFKAFLQDDYELIVFNDAPDKTMGNTINDTCAKYSLRCIRIPQEIHSLPYLERASGEEYNHPIARNCNVVQYSLNEVGFKHDDIVVLLDSDIFLIREFSIRDRLRNHDILGVPQSYGTPYLWIGFIFLNMPALPNRETLNVNSGIINNFPTDAGGHTYYYLKNNPHVKVAFTHSVATEQLRCPSCKQLLHNACPHNTSLLKEMGFNDTLIALIQSEFGFDIFENGAFIHYRGGTNWNLKSDEYHRAKTKILNTFIDTIISTSRHIKNG